MLDTLKFRITDYKISNTSELIIQPSSYCLSTNQKNVEFNLYSDEHHSIFGNKAYYNSDSMNVSLAWKKNVGVLLYCQISIPKVYKGNNLHSVGKSGSKAVINKVQENLKEIGIFCNVFDSLLSRVDLFKNIETNEKFLAYSKLFSELNVPRKQTRDYGTTFLFNNDSEEICIYDKLEEMRLKKIDISCFSENIVRFENRLLKSEKIKNNLQMNKVIDLFNNYDYLKEKFKDNLRKNIFRYSSKDMIIKSSKEIEIELLYFHSKYKNKWLEKYLMAKGSEFIKDNRARQTLIIAIKEVLSSEFTKEALKVKLCRYNKLLSDIETDLLMLKEENSSKKSIINLYDELKHKVLSA